MIYDVMLAVFVVIAAVRIAYLDRYPSTTEDVLVAAVSSAALLGAAVIDACTGNTVDAVLESVISALSLYEVWQWWRRRRGPRPSRVLGVIRDLGHRLVVVPVRGEAS